MFVVIDDVRNLFQEQTQWPEFAEILHMAGGL